MSYRKISARGIAKPEHSPLERGSKPKFAWLHVANLRVDDRYQRPLKRENITAIRRIAAEFSWIKFGALKVAPIAGTEPQLYAIMDGQHRATALDLMGVNQAPCVIHDADEAQQAAAFAAINGDVVRVLALTRFNALVQAKDREAVALTKICAEAGVTIAPYPIMNSMMKPGQTVAIGTLRRAVKRYGADALKLALRCITETSNNLPGAVHANVVQALCEIVDAQRPAPTAKTFIPLFDAIELDTLDSDSRAEKPRHAGDTARARLRDKIRAALDAQRSAAA